MIVSHDEEVLCAAKANTKAETNKEEARNKIEDVDFGREGITSFKGTEV